MDSPFSSVLNTNYIPSDDEAATIQKLVLSREAVVQDLNERIKALTAERDLQTKFIGDHNALVSPTRRLPSDILSSIFLSYLELCGRRSTYLGQNHPAVLLTHVCRRWRAVALEAPLLWTHVRFKFPVHPYHVSPHPRRSGSKNLWHKLSEAWNDRLRKEEQTFQMCLERSVSCPLNVCVMASDPYPLPPGSDTELAPIDEQARQRAIAAICTTSHRWEHISLDLFIYTLESPLLKFLQVGAHRTPLLRSIHNACSIPHYSSQTPDGVPRFHGLTLFGAPGLRTVKWGTPLGEHLASVLPVRWEGLTELFLGDQRGGNSGRMTFTHAITILERCPNLVHCTLTLRENPNEPVITTVTYPQPPAQPFAFNQPVTLPYLQSLGIRSTVIPTTFASALILPSLHTLLVYAKRCNNLSAEDSGLVQCIQMFGHQLQDVTFNYSSLSQSALLACLDSIPRVKSLRLSADYMGMGGGMDRMTGTGTTAMLDDATLSDFIPKFEEGGLLTGQCYCPKLERLSCHLAGQEFSEEALVKLVSSRRNIPADSRREVARIQDVKVRFDFSETLNVRQALQGAGVDMEGCSVQVRYRSIDKEAEKQLEYESPNEVDLYGDGFDNSFNLEAGPHIL